MILILTMYTRASSDSLDVWLHLNSGMIDSKCGEDVTYTLAKGIEGDAYWKHAVDETHWFIIDVESTKDIKKIRGISNRIADPIDVSLHISTDNTNWGLAVDTGITTWQDATSPQNEWEVQDITDKPGRYVKFVCYETEDGLGGSIQFGGASEIFGVFTIIDNAFGYGGYEIDPVVLDGYFCGGSYVCPENCTLDSISAFIKIVGTSYGHRARAVAWEDNGDGTYDKLTNGTSPEYLFGDGRGHNSERSFVFSTPPTLTEGSRYLIGVVGDDTTAVNMQSMYNTDAGSAPDADSMIYLEMDVDAIPADITGPAYHTNELVCIYGYYTDAVVSEGRRSRVVKLLGR